MKTLFCFTNFQNLPHFFELEGDYSRLEGCVINDGCDQDDDLTSQLGDLLYDEYGKEKIQMLDKPTKDWDFFVRCGFAP